jgi:hypothetical protein
MAVPVSRTPTLTLGRPQRLFASRDLYRVLAYPSYDVSADGQRIMTIAPVEGDQEEAASPKIRIVMNWYEEFRDRER